MGRKNNISLRNYIIVRDLIREIIKNLPRKKELLILGWMLGLATWPTHGEVIITSVLDGTLTGGCPKAIEIFIAGTEDLSEYEIWRSLNGAPFGSGTGAISSLTGVFSDTFVYLVKTDHAGVFADVFGNEGIFENVVLLGIISGNGNDGFQIRDKATGSVVDQVWTEDFNDSYRDSYWYRKHGTGPDGGWDPSSWETPGNDALDGLDEAGLRASVPFGTYAVEWLGISADWNDPANWSSGNYPSMNTNVFIPAPKPFFPLVNNPPDTPAVCRNLTLRDSAVMTVSAGKFLHVFHDVRMISLPPLK